MTVVNYNEGEERRWMMPADIVGKKSSVCSEKLRLAKSGRVRSKVCCLGCCW